MRSHADGTVGEPARHRKITDWPESERPREKLLGRGPAALTDGELLALFIRTGTGTKTALDLARQLLANDRALIALARRTPAELMRLPGIGKAKAVELAAAFELARRIQSARDEDKPILRSPDDVARLVLPELRDLPTEVFRAVLLDAKNGLIRVAEITAGTLNASLVHPREVFKPAIDHRAAAVIVVHNHPSGNPEPSREDVEITRQLAEAGKIIGIPIHDHIIVAGEKYTSMAERGLL